jgi:hypothetical protein
MRRCPDRWAASREAFLVLAAAEMAFPEPEA